MPGGTALAATTDVNRIEAPVTWKAYLICAFASFGGIFFGYDSGYINGVTGSAVFIHIIEGPTATSLTGSHNSLIVSILSAGTFFGALIAGDVAEIIGRRPTIIAGCGIYVIGVILQVASHGLGLLVAGRLIAGLGVGFESAIVILYMSEIVSFLVSFTYEISSADHYFTVPQEGSWCSRCRIPILYHSWSTPRFLHRLCRAQQHRH